MYVHPDAVWPLCEAIVKQAADDITRGAMCLYWSDRTPSAVSKKSSALRDAETARLFLLSKNRFGLNFDQMYPNMDGRTILRMATEQCRVFKGYKNHVGTRDRGIERGHYDY